MGNLKIFSYGHGLPKDIQLFQCSMSQLNIFSWAMGWLKIFSSFGLLKIFSYAMGWLKIFSCYMGQLKNFSWSWVDWDI